MTLLSLPLELLQDIAGCLETAYGLAFKLLA